MTARHEPEGAPHFSEHSCGKGRRRQGRAHMTPHERRPRHKVSREIGAGACHPAQEHRRGSLIAAEEPVNRRREHCGADPEADQAAGIDKHEASDRRVAPGGEQCGPAAERMAHDDGTIEGERMNELAEPTPVGVAIAGTFPRREPWLPPADPRRSHGVRAQRARAA